MEHIHSNTNFTERKRGQHLNLDERGIIQALKKEGRSNHYIADRLNCSVSTIGYELRRGTLAYCGKGRRPEYSAKRGEAAYRQNRSRCHRSHSVPRSSDFMRWMAEKVREFHWSFDVCVGYARRRKLFSEEQIPCTKTLYNLLWKGELPVSLFELPEVLNRRKRKKTLYSQTNM